MKIKRSVKYLFLILSIQILSYKIFPSNSLAEYSKFHEICNNDHKRASYGFSVDECSDYLQNEKENQNQIDLQRKEELERYISYYVRNNRHMLAANYYEQLLDYYKGDDDLEQYNIIMDYIDEVDEYCDSYSQRLKRWNTNNLINAGIGVLDLFHNNYSYREGMRNMGDSIKYEQERKRFSYYCGIDD